MNEEVKESIELFDRLIETYGEIKEVLQTLKKNLSDISTEFDKGMKRLIMNLNDKVRT